MLTRSRKKQLYTYMYISTKGHMVLPSSVVEFNKVCTQFDGKPALHLFSQRDAWFSAFIHCQVCMCTVLGIHLHTQLAKGCSTSSAHNLKISHAAIHLVGFKSVKTSYTLNACLCVSTYQFSRLNLSHMLCSLIKNMLTGKTQ